LKINPTVKIKLLAKCFEYVEQRIETSRQAMRHAQASANTEEKSSAGDKYETGRAMAQIERDKAAQQLDEAQKLKSILDQIKLDESNNKVTQGSLVITKDSLFYLAISVGKINIDDQDFLVIAPTSPIGQILLHSKVGDQFTFNKEIQVITQIC
jgi:transcription elongation GreA/GreB family factor